MMTPVYLNPASSPFSHVDDQQGEDEHVKLFISSSVPYIQAASSSSCSLPFPTFFGSLEDQTAAGSTSINTHAHDQSQLYHHKADMPIWHGGTSTYDQACSSSSSLAQPVVDVISNRDHNKLSICADQDHERESNIGGEEGKSNIRPRAVKWMSSKMRLMQKMTNPDLPPGTTDHIPTALITEHKFQIHALQHQENRETSFSSNNSNNTAAVRVCSDCNTNSTPLWRSGPRGPKSLCNACGIRQRKARRAMAEAAAAAANGFVVGTTDASPSKGKLPNKEKKSRGSHSNVTRCKNKSKLIITDSTSISHNNKRNNNHSKICFKAFDFQRVFPQDVAEAAMLLMELSCGLVNHS